MHKVCLNFLSKVITMRMAAACTCFNSKASISRYISSLRVYSTSQTYYGNRNTFIYKQNISQRNCENLEYQLCRNFMWLPVGNICICFVRGKYSFDKLHRLRPTVEVVPNQWCHNSFTCLIVSYCNS